MSFEEIMEISKNLKKTITKLNEELKQVEKIGILKIEDFTKEQLEQIQKENDELDKLVEEMERYI